MPVLFEPDVETVEDWRKWFGWLACRLGWHFGQIAVKDQVVCANCKTMYWKSGVLHWSERKYFLPRRSHILYNTTVQSLDLRDLFEAYICVDCHFCTKDAQKMLVHQKQWHNWRLWWRRLKDS